MVASVLFFFVCAEFSKATFLRVFWTFFVVFPMTLSNFPPLKTTAEGSILCEFCADQSTFFRLKFFPLARMRLLLVLNIEPNKTGEKGATKHNPSALWWDCNKRNVTVEESNCLCASFWFAITLCTRSRVGYCPNSPEIYNTLTCSTVDKSRKGSFVATFCHLVLPSVHMTAGSPSHSTLLECHIQLCLICICALLAQGLEEDSTRFWWFCFFSLGETSSSCVVVQGAFFSRAFRPNWRLWTDKCNVKECTHSSSV